MDAKHWFFARRPDLQEARPIDCIRACIGMLHEQLDAVQTRQVDTGRTAALRTPVRRPNTGPLR